MEMEMFETGRISDTSTSTSRAAVFPGGIKRTASCTHAHKAAHSTHPTHAHNAAHPTHAHNAAHPTLARGMTYTTTRIVCQECSRLTTLHNKLENEKETRCDQTSPRKELSPPKAPPKRTSVTNRMTSLGNRKTSPTNKRKSLTNKRTNRDKRFLGLSATCSPIVVVVVLCSVLLKLADAKNEEAVSPLFGSASVAFPTSDSTDQSASRSKRSSITDQSASGILSNTRLTSPIRTSPFGLPKKEQKKTVTDFLSNKNMEQINKVDIGEQKDKKDGIRGSKSALSKAKEDNLSKYYKKKLRRQKQEERLYFKIKKFVIRECKQDSENRLPASHFLRSRSLRGGNDDSSSDSRSTSRSRSNSKRGAASARAVRRHVRKRHKMATALQCDFKLKQVMHQLKRGKLVYMYSLAAYPDRYLRLFHTDVRNCYLASTFTAASGAGKGLNNEIQTKDQRVENPRQQWQQQYREFLMGPKATKLLQRCLERKIRHKASSLTELGRLLVDLRSIFIGLCSGSFRKCNQDFGVLVEAPIRNLYHKYGRKTRLLGEQIRDIILGCGRSPDFYHCTYASLKEYSAVYKRRKRK